MTRLLNMLNRDDVPEENRTTYDNVAEFRGGSVSGPYGILLHSPELAEKTAALGKYVRWNSDLTPAQREIAIITAARCLDAELMWGSHVMLAKKADVSESIIQTIGNENSVDQLDPEIASIVSFVRQLFKHNRVDDETFQNLKNYIGKQGIVDITGLVGYYTIVGFTLNAFEVPPPEGVEALPEKK